MAQNVLGRATTRVLNGATSSESFKSINNVIDGIEVKAGELNDGNFLDAADSVQEVFTLEITAAATVAGSAVLTLNGNANNIPLTISDINTNAAEINDFVNTLSDYSSTVVNELLTVTASDPGNQTDATYAAGGATSSAGTVVVTVTGATGTATATISTATSPYKVYKWDLLKENASYIATFVAEAANVETLP